MIFSWLGSHFLRKIKVKIFIEIYEESLNINYIHIQLQKNVDLSDRLLNLTAFFEKKFNVNSYPGIIKNYNTHLFA